MKKTAVETHRVAWMFAVVFAFAACGSEDDEPTQAGQGGTSGDGGSTSTAATSTSGQPTALSGGGGGGGGGDRSTGGDGNDQPDYSNTGLCAFAGTGVWQDGTYSGTHDLILVGDQGVGEDLCVVRYDANTVSDPEVPCSVISSGVQHDCSFGTVVELSNPMTMTDVDGVCGDSERGLDEDSIAARAGERFGMGFAPESTGHGNILVRFEDGTMTWVEWGSATFESDAGTLEYRQSDGICDY